MTHLPFVRDRHNFAPGLVGLVERQWMLGIAGGWSAHMLLAIDLPRDIQRTQAQPAPKWHLSARLVFSACVTPSAPFARVVSGWLLGVG